MADGCGAILLRTVSGQTSAMTGAHTVTLAQTIARDVEIKAKGTVLDVVTLIRGQAANHEYDWGFGKMAEKKGFPAKSAVTH